MGQFFVRVNLGDLFESMNGCSDLAPMSVSVKSRPELKFWANSSSPLKWTEIPS